MEGNQLNICLLPLQIQWGDKEKNLENLSNHFERIREDVNLVILPETFSTGFPSLEMQEKINDLAEENGGKTISFLKEVSNKRNFAIAGSFIAREKEELYNRSFFIQPGGEIIFSAKKHLFTPGKEDIIFNPGVKRLKVNYKDWKIDMIVCYDLRFPVWCRNRENEYDILIAVANWPVSRIDTWNTLLKARAMENSAYVCGVNCFGSDDLGGEYDGSCHVFNYKGVDLAIRDTENNLLYATVSMAKLLNYREKFPSWKDADDFCIL